MYLLWHCVAIRLSCPCISDTNFVLVILNLVICDCSHISVIERACFALRLMSGVLCMKKYFSLTMGEREVEITII